MVSFNPGVSGALRSTEANSHSGVQQAGHRQQAQDASGGQNPLKKGQGDNDQAVQIALLRVVPLGEAAGAQGGKDAQAKDAQAQDAQGSDKQKNQGDPLAQLLAMLSMLLGAGGAKGGQSGDSGSQAADAGSGPQGGNQPHDPMLAVLVMAKPSGTNGAEQAQGASAGNQAASDSTSSVAGHSANRGAGNPFAGRIGHSQGAVSHG